MEFSHWCGTVVIEFHLAPGASLAEPMDGDAQQVVWGHDEEVGVHLPQRSAVGQEGRSTSLVHPN
jgi:hypothetical protein